LSQAVNGIPSTLLAGFQAHLAMVVFRPPANLREIETALSKVEVQGGLRNEERMMAVDQTAWGSLRMGKGQAIQNSRLRLLEANSVIHGTMNPLLAPR
jgi:hypothetical protein